MFVTAGEVVERNLHQPKRKWCNHQPQKNDVTGKSQPSFPLLVDNRNLWTSIYIMEASNIQV